MSEQGWISLHRKLRDNAIYSKSNYLHIWIEILLKVNHKEKKIIWNNETFTIEEGGGIFSQKKISEELGIPIGTVHNCLKWLKAESMIEIKTTTKFTYIKVLNWNEYQEVESKVENRMKTKRKQNETNNNDNNDNNDNKKEKRESKQEKAFNIFWEEYPRKIGKSKSKELFKKIILSRKELKERNELFKEIIYAIRKQKKSKAWEDIKFIPHPTTWLNQGRWEDSLSKEELIYN